MIFARLPVGDDVYDRCLVGLVVLAEWQTKLLQSGIMRRYLMIIFSTTAVALFATAIFKNALVFPTDVTPVAFYIWPVVGLIVAGAWVTTVTTSRMAGICALGVVGAGIALLYMVFGAADVAMTQLMVEILIIVIIALVLPKLPNLRSDDHPGRGGRSRDAVVAIASGTIVTLIMLAVVAAPMDLRLTEFFTEASYPEARGRNIVNVILVDFRALDTFGEIAVVGIAGMACYALIKLRLTRRPDPDPPSRSAPGGDV